MVSSNPISRIVKARLLSVSWSYIGQYNGPTFQYKLALLGENQDEE